MTSIVLATTLPEVSMPQVPYGLCHAIFGARRGGPDKVKVPRREDLVVPVHDVATNVGGHVPIKRDDLAVVFLTSIADGSIATEQIPNLHFVL